MLPSAQAQVPSVVRSLKPIHHFWVEIVSIFVAAQTTFVAEGLVAYGVKGMDALVGETAE